MGAAEAVRTSPSPPRGGGAKQSPHLSYPSRKNHILGYWNHHDSPMFRPRRDPVTRNPMTEMLKVPPCPSPPELCQGIAESQTGLWGGWSNRFVEPDIEKAKDGERDGEIETETEMGDNRQRKT